MTLILHATDGSGPAEKALDFAIDMAKSRRAGLLILHVQRKHGSYAMLREVDLYEKVEHVRLSEAELLRDAAEQIVAESISRAHAAGLKDVEGLVEEGDAASRIVEIARERDVDTIVVGSRGLGDSAGLLLGSVSHKVCHLAPCTCVIVR